MKALSLPQLTQWFLVPNPAQEYTAEELESRLLPDLRAVCSSLKLDPKGKKAELIERILAAQESQ